MSSIPSSEYEQTEKPPLTKQMKSILSVPKPAWTSSNKFRIVQMASQEQRLILLWCVHSAAFISVFSVAQRLLLGEELLVVWHIGKGVEAGKTAAYSSTGRRLQESRALPEHLHCKRNEISISAN